MEPMSLPLSWECQGKKTLPLPFVMKSLPRMLTLKHVSVYRKPSQLLEVGPVIKDGIPVIKRFTGGGTVIVDKSTLFVSLICNKDDVPSVQPYPRSVMAWSGSLYGEVFEGVDGFHLRENGV